MESYGELLKKAREEQNLDFEQISRDTVISRQYLEALENEAVDLLPGEAYFVGFLKTYCEYLHLDSEEILRLYRAKKIQETPVPKELLQGKKKTWLPYVIAASSVAVLAGLFLLFYFVIFKVPSQKAAKKESESETQKIHQYTFTGRAETKRLYHGDQILVPDSNDSSKQIILTVNKTLGYLSIETPSGEQVIELSEERELDVDGDGSAELIVYLSDVSSLDSSYGAEVRIMQKNKELNAQVANIDSNGTDFSELQIESSANQKRTVIHESANPYPFTVNISFRGLCLFRYKIDNQPYVEDYYKSGDIINITATKRGFRLWMSNVNALKIQVQAQNSTYDLEVGRGGQVVVEDIRWIHDTDGRYKIILEEID